MTKTVFVAVSFLPMLGLEAGEGEDWEAELAAGEMADRSPFRFVGARLGMGTNRGTQLSIFELFGTTPAWKSWQPNSATSLNLHFEGSVGVLWEDNDPSFLTRIGPLLDLTIDDSPVHFIFGTSAAFLVDEKFGRLDLGSHYQFISSAGFDWYFTDDWVLGYRWQHISNAGLTDINPGLNLNTVSVGFRF